MREGTRGWGGREVLRRREASRRSGRPGRAGQAGFVLVVALVLLMIVTLLATTGMTMSAAELVMAGNEQFHRGAADAASAGVEAAVARVPTLAARHHTVAGAAATGTYSATIDYVGEEANLPGFSAEKFAALQFEIESHGLSARNAADVQIQGVMRIASRKAAESFVRTGSGLSQMGSAP